MRATRIVAAGVVAAAFGFGPGRARADAPTASPSGDEGKSAWLAATLAGGTALAGYGTAVGLAVWTDFEPEPVFLGALALGLLGPSAGHVYVGSNVQHPIVFGLGRIGFVVVASLGIADLLSHDEIQALNGQSSGKANKPLDYALIGVGITGVLGLTVWEAIDSASCAKASHGPPKNLALSPFLLPAHAGGFGSGGLLLSGRF